MARAWVQIVKKTTAVKYDRSELHGRKGETFGSGDYEEVLADVKDPEFSATEIEKSVDVHLSLNGTEAQDITHALFEYEGILGALPDGSGMDRAKRLRKLRAEIEKAIALGALWSADNATWDGLYVPAPVDKLKAA